MKLLKLIYLTRSSFVERQTTATSISCTHRRIPDDKSGFAIANHFVISVTILFTLLVGWLAPLQSHNSFSKASGLLSTSFSCPNICQVTDSLALVALYNATNGSAWNTTWNLNTPVCSWHGITLNSAGFVERINLNVNNLDGTLPIEIGDLSNLEQLRLDNNNLGGSLPSSIGNVGTLEIIFLDNNNFTGSIPSSFGNLPQLITLFLDNNQLSGTVPATLNNLTNLREFHINNNNIDSIPDLSGMISLQVQNNDFRIDNNEITFDDIIVHGPSAVEDHYSPQDSVFTETFVTLPTGSSYTVDLGFDSGVSTNVYQWYKDGIPYGAPLTTNKLIFDPILFTHSGEYRCQVTNTAFTQLTLHTRPIHINVTCGTSILTVNETLCEGESRQYNGVTYDASNPTGTELIIGGDQFGCDSSIIVNLNFHSENILNLNSTLCPEDTIFVDGVAYHQGNPIGSALFLGADQFGCDSTVLINLSFYPSPALGIIHETICLNDSILINGEYLHAGNQSTTFILANQSANGCDSMVQASIDFYPSISSTASIDLCAGTDTTIQGITFNQSNPSGVIIYENASQNGCDSTVNLNINFVTPTIGNYTATFCPGDGIVINGTTYDQSNPSGTEVLIGESYLGCDSTVQINLNYNSSIEETISPTLCQGDSILVNGVTYNAANPTGTEMLPGGSFSGCDSTIFVDLSFYPSYEGSANDLLCPGQFIVVNGTTYNQMNPSGFEVIANGSSTGCDSTVNISLTFYAQVSSNMTTVLCPGGSINVNGVTYDENNPNGTEILTGGSFSGCDSTVVIDLEFYAPSVENIITTLCSEDTLLVGGIAYHIDNPSGTEILENASINGCDSTVNIDLTFYEPAIGYLNPTLCPEQGIFINGVTYNESNPSGVAEFPNAAINGCDSLLLIQLSFDSNPESTLNPTLCPGDSIVVNGVTYNETNPTGTQYLENQAFNGCDSTVFIELNYYNVSLYTLTTSLCPGDSIQVNGTTYNFFHPTGTETLIGASYTGCDSIIDVNVNFFDAPSSTINATLCAEEEMIINGVVYNIDNPNGTELFSSASANGCDSVVLVDLTFSPVISNTIAAEFCPGTSIIVNGTLYDENNPTGTEVLDNATVSGCDSTIFVDLQFYEPAIGTLESIVCPGDTLFINGNAYYQGNSTGTEILTTASANGCDSIIQISLDFSTLPTGNLINTLCPGDTLFFNGNAYHQDNPSGVETLTNASVAGCDSIVNVTVNFFAIPTSNFTATLCPGDTIHFNGTAYHAGNSSGTELLSHASSNGCDSIINVNIEFSAIPTGSFTNSICPGDTLFLGGQAFHENNPSGSILLENASASGCDSLVQVNIEFSSLPTGNFTSTICPGDTLFLAGQVFHENNPTGSYLLENASFTGCDSLVQVDIDFYATTVGSFHSIICPEDTIIVNGEAFHLANPTGNIILENAAVNGCDSTILVQIDFFDAAQSILELILCASESININGTTYDQSNPNGIEIFQTSNGCDSVLIIELTFLDVVPFDTLASICEGDLFLLADRSFSETGSYEILLENGSTGGCDSLIQITLEVRTPELIGLATLGEDIIQCEQEVSLSANLPAETTGMWSSIDNMNISNPHDNNLMLNNLNPGWNSFIWTLSSDDCPNYDMDTIQVFVSSKPLANNDNYVINGNQLLEINLLDNDEISTVDAYFLELLSTPARGQLTELEEGFYNYERADILGESIDFAYQLCNEDCPELCDTAKVTIDIEQQSIDELDIPNTITPNDDGVNEFFMFPHLEYNPDQYPDKELIIFNRWGDIVYEIEPYQNDWYGQDKAGKVLPQGTYYYVLRLDINRGIILKGDITILK